MVCENYEAISRPRIAGRGGRCVSNKMYTMLCVMVITAI